MKNLLFILIIILVSCSKSEQDFIVDSKIVEEFDSCHEQLDSSIFGGLSGIQYSGYMSIIYDDDREFLTTDTASDLFQFVDTTEKFKIPITCLGEFKNDTAFIGGGIAWGGGVGFELKIFDNTYEGITWQLNHEIKTSEMDIYPKSLNLKSIKDKLTIDNEANLGPNQVITGKFVMESEEFFRKEDPIPHRSYLSVIFQCELKTNMSP